MVNFFSRYWLVLLLLVVAAVLVLGPILRSGGSLWLLVPEATECKLYGEGLGRPWQWNNGACFIQQPDGSVLRVDTNSNIRNP
jgi:hypothetical protein